MPPWRTCQISERDDATSKRVISTLRGAGLGSPLPDPVPRAARWAWRWSIDSQRSVTTARSGSRGSAAITYSRQPASCREERMPSTLASTNRSRSSGSTKNTPCTITMAIPRYTGHDGWHAMDLSVRFGPERPLVPRPLLRVPGFSTVTRRPKIRQRGPMPCKRAQGQPGMISARPNPEKPARCR